MSAAKQSRPKGTQDLVPPESERRRAVEAAARSVAGRFGFREIITPTFEHADVFVKSSGETSDVVLKEMYRFKDRADRDLVLRPEGTPGVVRAVLENNLALPARLCYVGPFFRYGRPQKGRLREFGQLGVEALGEATGWTDAELVTFGVEFFAELGITDCRVLLTSIGCRECRPGYRSQLVDYLAGRKDQLCPDCLVRLERNPMRVFDCKVETCRVAVADAPKPRGRLCPACAEHFAVVRQALDARGLVYEIDDRLVRGLDYYSRTTFEYLSARLGAQDSLGGGGRYDYLFEEFGGPATPAAGLAIGLERTMLAMPGTPEPARRRLAFVVWFSAAELDHAVKLADRLRAGGIPCRIDFDALGVEKKFKHQVKAADAQGAGCCVIVGPDELARGVYSVKDLGSGEQTEVPANIIIEHLRSVL